MNATGLKNLVSTVLLTGALLVATAVAADPPAHAKAHGWRKKNDPHYVGYTGRAWERDYGVVEGTCHHKEIGTVVGAVVGGAIGSQVGDGSGRTVAIILGSVLGAVVGREIGKGLDDGDRACVGHALELASEGHSVRWLNETTKVNYVLTPIAGSGVEEKGCRRFSIKATLANKAQTSDGRACRDSSGVWRM
jgi:surface antigen